MRVLYLGTPEFAAVSLRSLLDNGYDICGVFTRPDRPSGRGQRLHAPPVKTLAESRGIRVFQPEKLRAEENRATVENFNPDIIVTAAYGQLVPAWMLRLSRLFPVNMHTSLLPRWRGAAPVARAILGGDAVSGVTTMVMDESLDAGGVLLREEVPISLEATTGELTETLAAAGARLLIKTLEGLQSGKLLPTPQDETLVTWAHKITKSESAVSWERPAMEIHNRIRALNPWPGAVVDFRGEKVNLWRSLPAEDAGNVPPGTLLCVTENALRVACGGAGAIDIFEIQRPGKKRTNGREFASGARLKPGQLLT
ncbi:MAG: methionyl-tRNA formyltransferase [Acidobacteria bacterium]|nr:methionyl-tRNA formyltransferase [Acidobacteriota bacterium]